MRCCVCGGKIAEAGLIFERALLICKRKIAVTIHPLRQVFLIGLWTDLLQLPEPDAAHSRQAVVPDPLCASAQAEPQPSPWLQIATEPRELSERCAASGVEMSWYSAGRSPQYA